MSSNPRIQGRRPLGLRMAVRLQAKVRECGLVLRPRLNPDAQRR